MAYISNLFKLLEQINFITAIQTTGDIILVATVIYFLMMLVKGTRAWHITWGLVVFFGVVYLSNLCNLRTLSWILVRFIYLGPVALVILFYPELRQVLEEMGRVGFWGSRLGFLAREDVTKIVDEIVRVAGDLSAKKVGALIVIERETGLDDLVATGKLLDAEVSTELLATIFHPGSPLHDGGVIVRGNRIAAAACLLPLTDRPGVSMSIHTRHRAAIGASESSDAVVVVVSEETGGISISFEGKLIRGLSTEVLRERLHNILQPPQVEKQTRQFLGKMTGHAFDKTQHRL